MSFLSFFRRSVNENALSVKGKARCGATLDGKNRRRLIPKGMHVSVSLGFVERQKTTGVMQNENSSNLCPLFQRKSDRTVD